MFRKTGIFDNSWIVSRFCQCADGKVEALSDALQATVAKWKARIPMPLPLELYTSSTFIGLFVEEQVAELLKGFAADFASEAATKAGLIYHRMLVQSAEQEHHICLSQDVQALQTWCAHVFLFCPDVHMEPHKKQLHVTLAYHFHTSQLQVLEKLAKNVDVSSGCDWLAVLYSRDIRFANHEVTLLVSTLSKWVWSAASLSNAYRQHPRCRRCRSCTRMHLRMTTSWSWCLETSSSCRPWSRAPSARVGCTEPRWPRGCRACCLRTTSTEQMSPTPGSSTGKKRMFLCQDFQSEHKVTPPVWPKSFLNLFFCLCLVNRSYSILNCASPPNSSGSVSGLLFDGKLSDTLLDNLMDASSPSGLCPPMQVQHSAPRQGLLVLCLIISIEEMEMIVVVTCWLHQVMRTACQPSLSKMRLFVCRHGERMDVVFGKHWVTQCFDSKG